jgi:hypothetical protein
MYVCISVCIYLFIAVYRFESETGNDVVGNSVTSSHFGWYSAFAIGIGLRGFIDFPVWA